MRSRALSAQNRALGRALSVEKCALSSALSAQNRALRPRPKPCQDPFSHLFDYSATPAAAAAHTPAAAAAAAQCCHHGAHHRAEVRHLLLTAGFGRNI